MLITHLQSLHQKRMFRLRQLQKELTLQNRALWAWMRDPKNEIVEQKWRKQQEIVEQAQARFNESQEAYLQAAVRRRAAHA